MFVLFCLRKNITNKFFLNFEKKNFKMCNVIKKIIKNNLNKHKKL